MAGTAVTTEINSPFPQVCQWWINTNFEHHTSQSALFLLNSHGDRAVLWWVAPFWASVFYLVLVAFPSHTCKIRWGLMLSERWWTLMCRKLHRFLEMGNTWVVLSVDFLLLAAELPPGVYLQISEQSRHAGLILAPCMAGTAAAPAQCLADRSALLMPGFHTYPNLLICPVRDSRGWKEHLLNFCFSQAVFSSRTIS